MYNIYRRLFQVHLVHYSTKYSSLGLAADQNKGLAALGFMFEVYGFHNRYRTTTTTTLDCLPSVKSEASCGGLLQGKESIQNTSKIHEFSYLLLVSIPINPIDPIYE